MILNRYIETNLVKMPEIESADFPAVRHEWFILAKEIGLFHKEGGIRVIYCVAELNGGDLVRANFYSQIVREEEYDSLVTKIEKEIALHGREAIVYSYAVQEVS